MIPLTQQELIERMPDETFKFLFFWGHSEPDGVITKACLSQWYPSPFEVEGNHYSSAEHFMMAEKARLFDDSAVREEILACAHPAEAKKLGRKVKNFDDAKWNQNRFEIVVEGSFQKFSQNTNLGKFLTGTHNRILVEASPRDQVWGIGLGKDNPAAQNPSQWRGPNLLGFALMAAREKLHTN